MKRFAISFTLSALAFTAVPAHADDMFTGDTKTACEVILCLSSGTRPTQCVAPIRKYLSITARKFSDTLKKRKNFLNLCPAATQDPQMVALVDAINNGADRCDYASLNASQRVWNGTDDGAGYISNSLPSYCAAYSSNPYTAIEAPRYVGIPERGGFWVASANYETALAEYNKRIAAEDANQGGG